MKSRLSVAAGVVSIVGLVACGGGGDKTTGPVGQEAFTRYVAIGTSLSMGVQSDGVVYFDQQHDWTKLLAHQAFGSFS